jgi:hypothetical protein
MVDAQDAAWMPPWRRGRTERERQVYRLRVEARRLLREREALPIGLRLFRSLAWPLLLPIKACDAAKLVAPSRRWREWVRAVGELAGRNIRAGLMTQARAAGADTRGLLGFHIADLENQVLLEKTQGRHPSFRIGHKRIFADFCRRHALPNAPLLASGTGDRIMVELEPKPNQDLFFKPADSYAGRGACLLRAGGDGSWQTRDGTRVTRPELAGWARSRVGAGDWVLQVALSPDPRWAGWSSGALGTARLVTVAGANGEEPRVFAAGLRMPVADGEVDNYTSGGLFAEIDLHAGSLKGALGKSRPNLLAKHPDSGASITGERVPEWNGLVELAVHAHRTTDGLVAVGWDITLQPDGPLLIEANPVWNLWPGLFLGATDYLDVLSQRVCKPVTNE